MLFLFIAGVVVALAIIMTINKVKKKPKNVMDDLTENKTFQDLKNLVDAMSELNKNATAEDTIPEGYGEFGHEIGIVAVLYPLLIYEFIRFILTEWTSTLYIIKHYVSNIIYCRCKFNKSSNIF